MKNFKEIITEATGTIVFTFGRFNPPTTGHEKLIKKVASIAGSGPFRIYPSLSNNPKKDPLPFALKVAYMRKMFPRYAKNIKADKNARTAIEIAVKLYKEGFHAINMVVGSDRVKEFQTLLDRYNGVEARHGYYGFDDIRVISAGERDPDAEGVEGMSASKMRAAATAGDFDSFKMGVPSGFKDALKLYNDVRKFMGIREERDMGEMNDFESLRDLYLTGKIWNVGDIVEANGIKGKVIRKGTNYLSYVDEDNKVHKAWLHDINEKNFNVDYEKKYQPKGIISLGNNQFRVHDVDAETKDEAIKKAMKIGKFKKSEVVQVDLDERNYAKEYANYQGTPEQIARRSSRNKARRVMGDKAIKGMDVGHKDNNPMNNDPSNLRNEDPSINRKEPRLREVKQDSDIKDKKGTQPAKYYATDIAKSTKDKRAAHFSKKKAGPAPGDASAKTKPSKHTKKFKQMYGEELPKDADMGDYIDDFQKSDAPQFKGKSKEKRKDMAIAAYLDKNEEVDMDIYHLDEKIAGLVTKAKKSGMPYSILKKVYDRGMAAYKTGHRPGTTAQQWAFARVNSFTTKSSGTWGKADKDLAKQVRGENVEVQETELGMIPKKKRKGHEVLGPESVQEWFESNQTRASYQLKHGEDWWWKLQEVKESMLEKIGADCCDDCGEELKEEMTSEDSLKNWKYEDAKGYAEKLIDEYGQPDEVTETMLKWNKLGSFGKDERETYIIDESIPHAFPKPHKDYVYTVMNIKIPSDMLDTLGHVTGSIIYDGLKEEVTARCGSLYANAATMGFVRDMVDGKVPVEDGPAKDEYADRITKDPLPKFYDNKMNEGVEHMCGHCLDESLWANIHKKRQRIKGGSGEKMRKKGEKGAPTPAQMKRAKSEEALRKVKGTDNLYEPKNKSKSARMRSMIDFLNTQQKKSAEKRKKTKNTGDYKMRMYNSMENMWGEVTEKAEYQGRSVELNNPTQGDIKKYKVYVKNDKGNVVKVEFGDPNMSIKRDDPEARKAFRARHNCDQKKDKTTAGYWSCKFWSTKSVSDLMKG